MKNSLKAVLLAVVLFSATTVLSYAQDAAAPAVPAKTVAVDQAKVKREHQQHKKGPKKTHKKVEKKEKKTEKDTEKKS